MISSDGLFVVVVIVVVIKEQQGLLLLGGNCSHLEIKPDESCFFSPAPCSGLWRFHDQAEWNHHQSWVAKGVSYKQKLCLASGGPRSVPDLPSV